MVGRVYGYCHAGLAGYSHDSQLVVGPTCLRAGTRVWAVAAPSGQPAGGVTGALGVGAHTPSPPAGRVGVGSGSGSASTPPHLQAIESIGPGDWVVGHDGSPHRVLRSIQRRNAGEMLGLRMHGAAVTLWLTADQRVMRATRSVRYGGESRWAPVPVAHVERSRELRREQTRGEARMWSRLRDRRCGVKFRRQHQLGPYIADFYAREAALVVELDGDSHYDPEALEHDRRRIAYLERLGLRVLRFTNAQVAEDLDSVVAGIWDAAHAATPADDEGWEWREAGSLVVGDVLHRRPDLRPAEVVAIERAGGLETVYDLDLDGAHSFLTEVCCVHDCVC